MKLRLAKKVGWINDMPNIHLPTCQAPQGTASRCTGKDVSFLSPPPFFFLVMFWFFVCLFSFVGWGCVFVWSFVLRVLFVFCFVWGFLGCSSGKEFAFKCTHLLKLFKWIQLTLGVCYRREWSAIACSMVWEDAGSFLSHSDGLRAREPYFYTCFSSFTGSWRLKHSHLSSRARRSWHDTDNQRSMSNKLQPVFAIFWCYVCFLSPVALDYFLLFILLKTTPGTCSCNFTAFVLLSL